MTFVIPNNNYSAGTGTNSTSPFVEVFFPDILWRMIFMAYGYIKSSKNGGIPFQM